MRINHLAAIVPIALALVACGAPDSGASEAEDTAPAGAAAPAGDVGAALDAPPLGTPLPGGTAGGDEPTSSVAVGGGDAAAGQAAGAQGGAGTQVGAAPGTAGADPLSQDQAASILRRTAQRYADIRSMQAEFDMVYENRLLRSRVESRGTLYQRRPDRILLDFSDPEGDILLGDGTHFWMYYPSVDKAQATRTPQARGSAGVDLQAQFVGDPVERFEYTYDGAVDVAGRRTHAFTLTPRQPTDYTELKVWIDAEDSVVRRFQFTEPSGAVRRIELSGLRLNPTLDDARFRFVPPPGVRVVDRG